MMGARREAHKEARRVEIELDKKTCREERIAEIQSEKQILIARVLSMLENAGSGDDTSMLHETLDELMK